MQNAIKIINRRKKVNDASFGEKRKMLIEQRRKKINLRQKKQHEKERLQNRNTDFLKKQKQMSDNSNMEAEALMSIQEKGTLAKKTGIICSGKLPSNMNNVNL